MRLASLLAGASEEELNQLAVEHVPTDKPLARAQLCSFLEGALRSYRFANDFIFNRQPPTFAILTSLLEAPGCELPRAGFAIRIAAMTDRISQAIRTGELLHRDGQLHLYRRALYEARRNDLDIDASESAILAVLRKECGISQVEHFLIEHHDDFREFWDRDDAYLHEETALRRAGLIFHFDDRLLIPEDLASAIWQTLGIDMPSECARRLFEHFSNVELAEILEANRSRVSGTKEARVDRLLSEHVQPRVALTSVTLTTLRDICRQTEVSISGSKDDLIERIVMHFAHGKDQEEQAPPPPRILEPRVLDRAHFDTMFSALPHQELSDILRRFPSLRQTGTKEIRIGTLWEAHLSETTLLGSLMTRQLEDALQRLGLRFGGSKKERIERFIAHFAGLKSELPIDSPMIQDEPTASDDLPIDIRVAENQALFRQKASNPQSSLQPWLEQLLDALLRVRCYATEDANPTKQLKNKLSQAASAKDGLLVLLLSDEHAFNKAKEALLERWMTNIEWPKSIASVALAHPMARPSIEVIIEHRHNPWSDRIRTLLFPSCEIHKVFDFDTHSLTPSSCSSCEQDLPISARFCPFCGHPAASPT
jgi:hypothetical protein